ncbi:uncharacterized protein SPPG_06308 [Spizellomyces punctatus DAOM BR117]|uniref:RRM domain-containing protein n=1 Tax=Spizellomyces punctatus (strain DAOM BR117) TaxID=645134 RepID=A0A0L0HCG2_SPIPD|nr:uncharacterized protein SPPG_06308 [Spizellomyces punctatus DAOM BR117]KNC98626.1 hypothetical protein SPPG_06308 [Spizellomyces punctatus DAOM BR117]|eukprot:XP_016606666.1 hypothetical protein SPPG_06308 [Spizellomyces punctatus DAOM BR117]
MWEVTVRILLNESIATYILGCPLVNGVASGKPFHDLSEPLPMASLYGALEQTDKEKGIQSTPGQPPGGNKVVVPAGWASQARFIQPVTVKRKPQSNGPRPRSMLKNATKWANAAASLAEDSVGSPREDIPVQEPVLLLRGSPEQKKRQRAHNLKQSESLTDIYDPASPNEFYAFKKEAKRRKDVERGRNSSGSRNDPIAQETVNWTTSSPPSETIKMLPDRSVQLQTPLDMSGEEAYMRRARLTGAGTGLNGQNAPVISPVHQEPSRVVLLINMVGPGEADASLQQETAEECSRYGKVERCTVFEVPYHVPEEEAVRIFVEFSDIGSAVRGMLRFSVCRTEDSLLVRRAMHGTTLTDLTAITKHNQT